MMSEWDDVVEFQKKFCLPQYCGLDLSSLNSEQRELIRFKLEHLQEELDEMLKAYHETDTTQFFDGIIDLVYVALGLAVNCGFPWEEGWKIVHGANMKRIRSDDTIPGRSYFDVVKPEGWQSPDLQLRKLLSSRTYNI